jgi:hypothetical protein
VADDTQRQDTPATSSSYGYCAWHRGITRDLRLIHIAETGSGPGAGRQQHACHPCQIEHGLVPLADRPAALSGGTKS